MTMETERGINKLAPNQQINGNSSRISSDGSSMPRSPRVEKSTKSMGDKRSDLDFIFGKLIGEGSFSSVYLAKDIHTNHEYAVKVCEKQLIIREKKVQQITREKDVMNLLNSNQNPKAPFFVKLSYAFQGEHKLYFVMTYCKNGELLNLIQRVGNFDRECARFYTAELVRALEHLHSLNIIHRDLKPENILLDEHMHIKITDFGCAKILTNEEIEAVDDGRGRKSSFVGTAQYVSPELLESKKCGRASDLWALGCILYQMVSGLPPFRSRSEYYIFQKILKLEYEFPEGFCEEAKDLVQKLLVVEADDRLGAQDCEGYPSIRCHPLFAGLDFDSLHEMTPPKIAPFMPHVANEIEWEFKSEPGLKPIELQLMLGLEPKDEKGKCKDEKTGDTEASKKSGKKNMADVSQEEFILRLAVQERENKWHKFVENNLILKQGLMDKRKGLFPRRRMFLLTTGPHLYYVDPANMVLKGQIPWCSTILPEAKNFKTFFVHTPNRTYYLEDPNGYALEWCKAIEEVKRFYYPENTT
ncbi:3-phosphoinositide-dependent protein kinase 1-like [Homarus americanus]|uniref:3-phosphoinositide-dependent protein kinase 1-like n=1 Tax=Homarus americanus TaxID=6706 RepID=UPI001C46D52A|nr:3-phosphoinositide-dependent protein kinase 1-like [Homarus americanus]XP_042231317.1 3-phosphoinositide-dependent protein kinase 1-like [Homarus americanus]